MSGETEPTEQDKEIEKLLKDFQDKANDADSKPAENVSDLTHILTPQIIAESLGSITSMLSRWAGIKEIEFTDEDKKDLANALKPFESKLDELLKYMPYLPLGMFAVGYGMRIIGGYKEKRNRDKEMKEIKAAEVAKLQETAKANADKAKVKDGPETA